MLVQTAVLSLLSRTHVADDASERGNLLREHRPMTLKNAERLAAALALLSALMYLYVAHHTER